MGEPLNGFRHLVILRSLTGPHQAERNSPGELSHAYRAGRARPAPVSWPCTRPSAFFNCGQAERASKCQFSIFLHCPREASFCWSGPARIIIVSVVGRKLPPALAVDPNCGAHSQGDRARESDYDLERARGRDDKQRISTTPRDTDNVGRLAGRARRSSLESVCARRLAVDRRRKWWAWAAASRRRLAGY